MLFNIIAFPIVTISMLVVTIPLVAWKAYVLSWLWLWFITPLNQIPPPSVIFIMGLLTMLVLLKSSVHDPRPFGQRLKESLLDSVFRPALGLLLAWIYHQFA